MGDGSVITSSKNSVPDGERKPAEVFGVEVEIEPIVSEGKGVATKMSPGVDNGADECQKNSQSDFEKSHGC